MRLDWRKNIVYLAIMGAVCCWLYVLLGLVNVQAVDSRISVIGLVMLYPVSFAVNKLLNQLRWPDFIIKIISWLVWIIALLLIVKVQLYVHLELSDTVWLTAVPRAIADIIYSIFKPELLILLGSAAIWWLGRRLSYIRVNFNAAVGEFQFGLLVLAVVYFIAYQIKADTADFIPASIVFFIFALLGVSIAHAREDAGWIYGIFQGHWYGLLFISIGIILFVGLLISAVATPDFVQLILNILKWLWGLVEMLMTFLASLIPPEEPVELPPALVMPEMDTTEGMRFFTMPPAVRNVIRIGWTVMVLGILVLALWRISTQIFDWMRRRSGASGGEVEALHGAFRADLLRMLKYIMLQLLGLILFRRFRKRREPVAPEVASVRGIYRHLLRWASSAGYPREPYQTPIEYLGLLVELLPESEGDLVFITQQYVDTRYGSAVPSESIREQLRQSWHRVRQNRLKK